MQRTGESRPREVEIGASWRSGPSGDVMRAIGQRLRIDEGGPLSVLTRTGRAQEMSRLKSIEVGLAQEFEEVFLRRWGNTGWRDRIQDVRPIVNQELTAVLGAAAAIEMDAYYMRLKLRVAGLFRSPTVDGYTSVWLAEETDHGRAFDALVRQLSGGEIGAQKPDHGTLSRDPRAVIALPAMWLFGRSRRLMLAGYLVRGALVEHMAITIYRALARELSRVGELAGSEIVGSITSQEGRHLRFFSRGAQLVLGTSPTMATLVRRITEKTWRPPGVDLYGRTRWAQLFGPVLADTEVLADLAAIDAKVSMLPGFADSTIVKNYIDGIIADIPSAHHTSANSATQRR